MGEAASTLIRCDALADLPAFIGHAHAVVAGGERFGWWVDHGFGLVLAFLLDMEGAAYRLCSPEGETVGLFVSFLDCVRTGATLYELPAHENAKEGRRRARAAAPRGAH